MSGTLSRPALPVLPAKQKRKLSSYQLSHLKQLKSLYRSLADSVKIGDLAGACQVADEILKKADTESTWEDLCSLEMVLLRIEPLADLRRDAWRLRARYRDIAGEAAYARYLESRPPDPAQDDEDAIRADLVKLLSEIQWLQSTIIPTRENRRLFLTWLLAATSLVIFTVGLVILTVSFWRADSQMPRSFNLVEKSFDFPVPPILAFALCIVCGTLGASISVQRRLQGIASEKTSFVELEFGWPAMALAPLSGAVFATIMYLLFASKLLSGEMFPAISPQLLVPYKAYIWWTGPSDVNNLGKLLVWSFIAGFAERLVPDALDRLANRVNSTPVAAPK